jgi:hypothetical protein
MIASSRTTLGILAGLGLALLLLVLAGPSAALGQTSWWTLNSTAAPTLLPREGEGQLLVSATNMGYGEVDTSGEAVTLTDELPPGITPVAVEHRAGLTCSIGGRLVSCSFNGTLRPYQPLPPLHITVSMESPLQATPVNIVSVRGAETTPVTLEQPLSLQRAPGEPTPFGVQAFSLTPESGGEDGAQPGSSETLAGSHPFQLTTTLNFNQILQRYGPSQGEGVWPSAPALPRDLRVKLPPGLIGDPNAAPQCPGTDFSSLIGIGDLCPADTAVGVAQVTAYDPRVVGLLSRRVPIFNLQPAPGEPARFGFLVEEVPIVLKTAVPSGGEYGVQVSVSDISQAVQVLSSQLTFWGVPGDSRHNAARGWGCLRHEEPELFPCEETIEPSPRALLTLPTSCERTPESGISGDSWAGGPYVAEQRFAEEPNTSTVTHLPAMTGCEAVEFAPSLAVEPEQHSASTPTGFEVGVSLPQTGLLAPEGRAESAVKNTTVSLPLGVQVSPSAANGLAACSLHAIGYEGRNPGTGILEFEEEAARQSTAQEQEQQESEGRHCPKASELGTVEIETPLLDEKLSGEVYLAEPAPNGEAGKNPFDSLVALYIVAENPKLGVLVKLAGEGHLDESTGQITTSFKGTPQVPFSSLALHLFGGARGSVSTPPLCGEDYAASSEFGAWSGISLTPLSRPPFKITTGPGGEPCPSSPLPFSPSLTAGTANTQASALTPFTLTIDHADGDQALQTLNMTLPPGVAALLASVAPCHEPPPGQQWACGPESLIGHSSATVGLGAEPYALPGQVYLTTGYGGAPFGVLVVTPAIAGPFNLGDVDVRSRLEVNPVTAAASIVSDPFPTMIKGVPAQIKQVEVSIDRPGFTFNPSNCSAMRIGGTLGGAEGASATFSYPFQVSNCASLPFAPTLTASAGGHGSKQDGTSLTVKVSSAGLGQANIAKVDLTFPKALPSRLSTLQKACLHSVFEANPASCDEGSVIGEATVHTPVLRNPLTGPGYLVAHGSEFPDVEFVLQGEGITVVLDGKTDITHGITYSKFESAPDVPFTTFETELPAGPHSAFTPSVAEKEDFSLCKTSLSMPTAITGQNGAVIEQDTKIAVTGCGGVKAYKVTRAQQLAKALKACKKRYAKNKRTRAACEKQARKQYGAKAAKKK